MSWKHFLLVISAELLILACAHSSACANNAAAFASVTTLATGIVGGVLGHMRGDLARAKKDATEDDGKPN